MTSIDADQLVGSWLHAHEDSAPQGCAVYRRDADLPPSRGRRGFILGPDGRATELSPGPSDGHRATATRWSLTDDGHTLLIGRQRYGIRSLSEDRLVIAEMV